MMILKKNERFEVVVEVGRRGGLTDLGLPYRVAKIRVLGTPGADEGAPPSMEPKKKFPNKNIKKTQAADETRRIPPAVLVGIPTFLGPAWSKSYPQVCKGFSINKGPL